jgi:hypothetical protein
MLLTVPSGDAKVVYCSLWQLGMLDAFVFAVSCSNTIEQYSLQPVAPAGIRPSCFLLLTISALGWGDSEPRFFQMASTPLRQQARGPSTPFAPLAPTTGHQRELSGLEGGCQCQHLLGPERPQRNAWTDYGITRRRRRSQQIPPAPAPGDPRGPLARYCLVQPIDSDHPGAANSACRCRRSQVEPTGPAGAGRSSPTGVRHSQHRRWRSQRGPLALAQPTGPAGAGAAKAAPNVV